MGRNNVSDVTLQRGPLLLAVAMVIAMIVGWMLWRSGQQITAVIMFFLIEVFASFITLRLNRVNDIYCVWPGCA